MNALERLRLLRDNLPAHGSIMLTREALSELLGEVEPKTEGDHRFSADLTVEEVAADLKRSPSRVRDFIRGGELKAYKFGKEYRCTRASVEAFLEGQREGKQQRATPTSGVDLGAWRKLRPAA